MIQQFKNQLKMILFLSVTFICFQNFDFSRTLSVNLLPENERARKDHAQELLGHNYVGSTAQRIDPKSNLGTSIFDEVYVQLPLLYKDQAFDLAATIVRESEKYKMDPVFVMAIIRTESRFNPEAKGRFGEIGLMQIKPATAEWISKKIGRKWLGAHSLYNPIVNVKISLAYMAYLRKRFNNDPAKYITAYNMGVTNVNRNIASGSRPREYSDRVLTRYFQIYKSFVARSSPKVIAQN